MTFPRVRFDGTINLGHILMALSLAIPGVWWGATLDGRVATLEVSSGVGSRIIDGLRDNVAAQERRIAILEAAQASIIDRLTREYEAQRGFEQRTTERLEAITAAMSDIRSSVAAIAASVTTARGGAQ